MDIMSVIPAFMVGKVTQITIRCLESFLADEAGKSEHEASMSMKNAKLKDTGGTKQHPKEVTNENELEERISKIIEYSILAAADWDEEQAGQLKQKLNQHAWNSLFCNHSNLPVLWSRK